MGIKSAIIKSGRTFRKRKPEKAKTKVKKKGGGKEYWKNNWQLYVLVLPAIIYFFVFNYLPLYGIQIAFKDYNPFKGVFGSEWVGLKHFTRFLSSPDFMGYLANTLKLSVYSLLWGFPVPIILALLLNRIQSTGIKKKIQLILYLPNFVLSLIHI